MKTFIFYSLFILLGVGVFILTPEEHLSDPKSAYVKQLRKNPWKALNWDNCDTPFYPEWHYCHNSRIAEAESMRRLYIASGYCEETAQQDFGEKFLNIVFRDFPDACNKEKTAGYDAAIIKKYELILDAMREQQGKSIPTLTAEQKNTCDLERHRQRLANEPFILYEMRHRRCANRVINE